MDDVVPSCCAATLAMGPVTLPAKAVKGSSVNVIINMVEMILFLCPSVFLYDLFFERLSSLCSLPLIAPGSSFVFDLMLFSFGEVQQVS